MILMNEIGPIPEALLRHYSVPPIEFLCRFRTIREVIDATAVGRLPIVNYTTDMPKQRIENTHIIVVPVREFIDRSSASSAFILPNVYGRVPSEL